MRNQTERSIVICWQVLAPVWYNTNLLWYNIIGYPQLHFAFWCRYAQQRTYFWHPFWSLANPIFIYKWFGLTAMSPPTLPEIVLFISSVILSKCMLESPAVNYRDKWIFNNWHLIKASSHYYTLIILGFLRKHSSMIRLRIGQTPVGNALFIFRVLSRFCCRERTSSRAAGADDTYISLLNVSEQQNRVIRVKRPIIDW